MEKRIINNKFIVISFFGVILLLLIYGYIHEAAHWSICNLSGLQGKINIDIFKAKPDFSINCEGIDAKPTWVKFLFSSSPYILSLILLISIFMFLHKKNSIISLILSLPIFLSDLFNLIGFYRWFLGHGDVRNDLVGIYYLNKVYLTLFLILISANIVLFAAIVHHTFKTRKRNQKNK